MQIIFNIHSSNVEYICHNIYRTSIFTFLTILSMDADIAVNNFVLNDTLHTTSIRNTTEFNTWKLSFLDPDLSLFYFCVKLCV